MNQKYGLNILSVHVCEQKKRRKSQVCKEKIICKLKEVMGKHSIS